MCVRECHFAKLTLNIRSTIDAFSFNFAEHFVLRYKFLRYLISLLLCVNVGSSFVDAEHSKSLQLIITSQSFTQEYTP